MGEKRQGEVARGSKASMDLGSASRVKKPSSGGWWPRRSMAALDGKYGDGRGRVVASPWPPVACAQGADAEAGRPRSRGRRDITAGGERARAPHAGSLFWCSCNCNCTLSVLVTFVSAQTDETWQIFK